MIQRPSAVYKNQNISMKSFHHHCSSSIDRETAAPLDLLDFKFESKKAVTETI